jgi:RNA polymerase sigma-70 factor (ECF subfamily)
VTGIELHETFADAAANNEFETVRAAEELSVMLQRLPPRQREALESLRLRELSAAQAAAALGQSAGAIKVNAHRALKNLRALFGSHG